MNVLFIRSQMMCACMPMMCGMLCCAAKKRTNGPGLANSLPL